MADDGNSATSNAIWAVVVLLIVVLILGFIYMSGIFNRKKQIDISIDTPGIVLPLSVINR